MSKNKIYLPKGIEQKKVLIYGAGVAGKLIFEEITRYRGKDYYIVGFLDDDPKFKGKSIKGKKIFGGQGFLKSFEKTDSKIDEILIAIPSASAKVIKKITSLCDQLGIQYKILPGIYDIITGKMKIDPIREIRIEDVLGRDSIKVSFEDISNYLEGKVMVVFGAGGSIGSEIVRQITEFRIKKIVVVDQNESELYDLHMEMLAVGKSKKIVPFVGDIRNYDNIEELFKKYKPDIVFHAAAYKHVPLMEGFPIQAIETNVKGTLNLLRANTKFPSKSFVFISTDKAVYPENVMGLTKRIGELLITYWSKNFPTTVFSAVRFGNVLGSRGSVVPLFLKQISKGGPVTVTHPDVERFFMTIPEAVQLVLQASSKANGGEIFMLEMGEKVKILDLAKQIIELSGYKPGRDIKIKFVGLRPGEKITEVLHGESEKKLPTEHDKISKIITKEKLDVINFIDELLKLVETKKVKLIVSKLKEIK